MVRCPICQRRRQLGLCVCGFDLLSGDASRVSARARRDLKSAHSMLALGATFGGVATILGLVGAPGAALIGPVGLALYMLVRGVAHGHHARGRLVAASGGMLPAARVVDPERP